MVEGDERRDAAGEEAVDEAVVEGEAGLVHLAGAGGQDAWPGDGEPVCLQAERGHQVEVVVEAVVVVARHVAVIAVHHLARYPTERVPDGRTTPVGVDGSLDLVRGRGGTPQEAMG